MKGLVSSLLNKAFLCSFLFLILAGSFSFSHPTFLLEVGRCELGADQTVSCGERTVSYPAVQASVFFLLWKIRVVLSFHKWGVANP